WWHGQETGHSPEILRSYHQMYHLNMSGLWSDSSLLAQTMTMPKLTYGLERVVNNSSAPAAHFNNLTFPVGQDRMATLNKRGWSAQGPG
ncbi:MAG: hypothetical protein ACE5EY_13705, partial [Anaerolineae bacterium]